MQPLQRAEKEELLRLLEEKRRRTARDNLSAYCRYIEIPGAPLLEEDPECEVFYSDTVVPAAHHELINVALMKVENGEIPRLLVIMPPGSAKSTYGTVTFPTWYIGRKRGRQVITASYNSELAYKFSRRNRAIARSKQYRELFDTELTPDNRAVHEWSLTSGSNLMAAGLLSGITGNRADLFVIDDPLKGRQDADSPVIRETIWQEYLASVRSRLKPRGAVVLIQCMVGSTRVLMEDGAEKQLKEIRPGDIVASYEDGKIVSSKVVNWINQGPDSCFEIKTTSGIKAKANERHPFLVYRSGVLEWVRLRDLKVGDKMIRVTGESGEESSALLMGASCPQDAKGCATRTTTRSDGLMEFVRRLLKRIPLPGSAQSSNIATASLSAITSKFLQAKAAFALSVLRLLSSQETPSTGMTSCASTTATIQKRSGGFYATTATSPSDGAKHQRYWKPPLDTFGIDLDEIVEIAPAGTEDVFDIQVEGTENFIANGLVSHNTRWHEDDLAGRILPKDYAGQSGWVTARDGEKWWVIRLPAQCDREDDPLGRKIGEWLWTDWFTPAHWEQEKRSQGSRNWSALYQGNPRPDDGGIFKESWCRKRYGTIPVTANVCVHSWDTAQKEKQINDPSACSMWNFGPGAPPGYYLREVYRDRLDYPALRRKVIAYAERDKPHAILIEDKSSGQSLIQDLRNSTSLPIIAIEPEGNKIFRASEVSAMVESGLVHLPEAGGIVDHLGRPISSAWLADFEGEFFGFPLATNDDQVDSVTQFLKWVRGWLGRFESHGAGMKRTLSDEMGRESDQGFGSVGRLDGDTTGFM